MMNKNTKALPLYVGTLYAQATLMSLSQYNEYRGWKLPANENGEEVGYLVIHPEGVSNTSDEIGYVSWVPKAFFESTHQLVGNVSNLPPFHQRLKAERTQLIDRIQKLVAFIGTDNFLSLDPLEQSRMNGQLDYMQSYRRELDERLIALEEPKAEA